MSENDFDWLRRGAPHSLAQDLSDGGVVDAPDPEEALTPGSDTDVVHAPEVVDEHHLDYAHPADVPEVDDGGGRHL